MKLGFVVLVHENLDRVFQLVDHLVKENCPVSLHIDEKTDADSAAKLRMQFQDEPLVVFPTSINCEWGRFSLVEATLNASELLLNSFPDLNHVSLISGSCLPTRPIAQLKEYLSKHQKTDFIESVSVENDQWVAAGLNEERFTLYFPISWRTNRYWFDRLVELQRKLAISRKIPENIIPHTGSQWWCLTARTLRKIITDPKRAANDAYFRDCWIPDESYFQSLARTHSERIEARSLTFSKFDAEGRPYVMYDDHYDLLLKTDAFFARKIWSGSELLYEQFLKSDRHTFAMLKSGTVKLLSYFDQATAKRQSGGQGRFNPGRYPGGKAGAKSQTVAPYAVYVGFNDLFIDFPDWLAKDTNTIQHGNLFHRSKVEFATDDTCIKGNLTANVKIRNRDPKGFLMNLLWNMRDKKHGFQFDLRDHQRVRNHIFKDKNANILIIKESWILKYLAGVEKGKDVLSYARRLQNMERSLLKIAKDKSTKANVLLVDLQDVLETPANALSMANGLLFQNDMQAIQSMPALIDLDGINSVIGSLRNQGMSFQTEEVAFSSPNLDVTNDFRPKLVL